MPEPHIEEDLSPLGRVVLELVQLSSRERAARLAELAALQPEVALRARRRLRVLDEHDLLGPHDDEAGTEPVPRTVAGYRILRRLGSGGMGVVWLAEQPALQRTVALKLMHEAALASERARERFRREALLAARLDHPSLCPVHEVGEVDGVPFLAMRYVPGQTLGASIEEARTRQRPPVHLPGAGGDARQDVLAVVELVERVARAIHCAHLAGLVHRDLKPDNIVVEPDGTPVVLDFGLAQDASSEGRLTVSGDRVGTPVYMAPEQVAGRGERLDARADVYALGAVLYECLTLELPVQAADRESLYRAIANGRAADAARSARTLERDLRVILAVAMAPEPQRRYASALAFAEDLARFGARQPILAQPAGTLLRARRWTQRNPVAALLLVTFASGLALTGVLLREVQAARLRAEDLASAGQARAIAETDPVAGLALALAAYDRTPEIETLSTLYQALAASHEERVFTDHTAAVWRTVFSGDGRYLASCSDDKTVRIWDLRQEGPARSLRHGDKVLDIDTDGTRFVTASSDGEVRLWAFDVSDGKPLGEAPLGQRTGQDAQCLRARFAPNGKRVFIASFGTAAWLWDIQTNAVIPLAGLSGAIWDCAFSRQGDLLVTLTGYGERIPPPGVEFAAHIWRMDGTPVGGPLTGHTRSLTAAAFSPAADSLLTASRDGTVRLWRANGEFVRTVVEYSSGIRCVQIHPDGELFAAAAFDGHVRICRLDGSPVASFAHEAGVRSLEFSRDGRTVLTAGWDRTAQLHDLRGRLLRVFRGHAHHVMHATFSPDGRHIATASYDHTVRLWRADDSQFGIHLGHEDRVVALASTGDGALATGSLDGNARLWTDGRAQVLAVGVPVNRIAWSPSGRWLATAHDDHTVAVWSRTGNRRGAPFAAPSRSAMGFAAWRNPTVAFLDDERLLVGCQDGTVEVFDLDGKRLPGPAREPLPAGQRYPVELLDLAAHPEGKHFAEGLWDWRARVRDLDGNVVATAQHADKVVKVQFSPDGRLLTASADKTARLWRWEQGRLEGGDPMPHEAALTWAAFSPDGQSILTTAMDGVARIWSLEGKELLRIRTGPSAIWCGAWSKNGEYIWTGSENGIVRSWPVDLELVIALARERARR